MPGLQTVIPWLSCGPLFEDWYYICYFWYSGCRDILHDRLPTIVSNSAIPSLWFLCYSWVSVVLPLGSSRANCVCLYHTLIHVNFKQSFFWFPPSSYSSYKNKSGRFRHGISPVFFWCKKKALIQRLNLFSLQQPCQVWVLLLQLCYRLAVQTFIFWCVRARIEEMAKQYWRGYPNHF